MYHSRINQFEADSIHLRNVDTPRVTTAPARAIRLGLVGPWFRGLYKLTVSILRFNFRQFSYAIVSGQMANLGGKKNLTFHLLFHANLNVLALSTPTFLDKYMVFL